MSALLKCKLSHVFFLIIFFLITFSANAENLSQALRWAYDFNPQLAAQRASVKQSVENIELAKSGKRPSVSFNSSLSHSNATDSFNPITSQTSDNVSNTLTASLVASLLIYDGGRSNYAIEAAKSAVQAAEYDLLTLEQQVFLQTINAYIDVLAAQEALTLQNGFLTLSQNQRTSAQISFDEGALSQIDLSTAQAQVASADAQVAFAQANLDSAKENFRALTGRLPGSLTPLSAPRIPNSEQAAVELGLQNTPTLKAAIELERSAQFDLRRAQNARLPEITASASASASRDLDRNQNSQQGTVGLDLSLPIYQGGQISALQRQAEALLELRAANTTQARVSVEQNIRIAWANFVASQSAYKANTEAVSAQERANEASRIEFELGGSSLIDRLSIEQDYLAARNSAATARFNVLRAQYNILALMGQIQSSRQEPQLNTSYESIIVESEVPPSEEAQAVENIKDRWSRD